MLIFSVLRRRGKMSMRGVGLDLRSHMPSALKGEEKRLLPLKKRKYVSETTTDDVHRDLPVSRTSPDSREGHVVEEGLTTSRDLLPSPRPDETSHHTPKTDIFRDSGQLPKQMTQVELLHQRSAGRSSMAPYLQEPLQSQPQSQQTRLHAPKVPQFYNPACTAVTLTHHQPSTHLPMSKVFQVSAVARNPQSFVSQIVSSMTKGHSTNVVATDNQSVAFRKGDLRRRFLANTAAARSGLPNWKPLDLSTKHISKSSSSGGCEDEKGGYGTSEKRRRTEDQNEEHVEETSLDGAAASGSQSPSMPINPQHSLRMLRECELAVRPDADGDLPLHIAVVKGDNPTVEKLLPMMTVAGVSLDYANKLRQTALHLAVITRQPLMVAKLVQEGASPDIPDRHGNTSTHLAVNSSRECLSCILVAARSRPNLDAKNYEGFAPLHLAVQKSDIAMVKILLEKGASIDITDGKSGRTPLHHAAETRNYLIVKELLTRSARVNVQSYSGNTPLHTASERNFKDIVNALVRYGADPTIRNANNETYTKETKAKGHASTSGVKQTGRQQASSAKKTPRIRRSPKHKSLACQAKLQTPLPVPFDCDHDYFIPAIPKTNYVNTTSQQVALRDNIQVRIETSPMGTECVPNTGQSTIDSLDSDVT